MRNILGVFIVVFLIAPFTYAETNAEIQAKIDALMTQIRGLQATLGQTPRVVTSSVSANCPAIIRALALGARGSDVTALQVFLKARGYFSEEATGYFGALTEAAVQKMQAANNLVSSGTVASTGYGALGPRTRALIASLCSSTGTPSPASTSQAAPTPASTLQCPQITSATAPAASCGGSWQKLMSLGCHVGWKCVLSSFGANKPPIISSIDGPTSLDINAYATWKVNAVDPEGGALTYSVTWGDEAAADILLSIAGLGGSYSSSASMSHSFLKAGTRFVEFSVKDSAGAVSTGAITVRVASGAASGTYTNPVTPAPSAASCITPWGSQVVISGSIAYWQPFFTEGAYFATTSPVMRCDNGSWKKCDIEGNKCQTYTPPTSPGGSGAFRSYPGTIGTPCPKLGNTLDVSVPPGTQLCQWLSCTITTEIQTVKLRCTDAGWTDFVKSN
ncbi:MAG: peptidoglycan-binding domain-containing protein [Minisyncoccia bacterium]